MDILSLMLIAIIGVLAITFYKRMNTPHQLKRFNEKNMTSEADKIESETKRSSVQNRNAESKGTKKKLTNKSTSYFSEIKRAKKNPTTTHLPMS